jgi:hypothetical protein
VEVEYRVILYNGTTKKTSELWNTPSTGYYYKKWQPLGNYAFPITWVVKNMEKGAYSLTILVRRVGSKAPYDNFVNTNSFRIVDKYTEVESWESTDVHTLTSEDKQSFDLINSLVSSESSSPEVSDADMDNASTVNTELGGKGVITNTAHHEFSLGDKQQIKYMYKAADVTPQGTSGKVYKGNYYLKGTNENGTGFKDISVNYAMKIVKNRVYDPVRPDVGDIYKTEKYIVGSGSGFDDDLYHKGRVKVNFEYTADVSTIQYKDGSGHIDFLINIRTTTTSPEGVTNTVSKKIDLGVSFSEWGYAGTDIINIGITKPDTTALAEYKEKVFYGEKGFCLSRFDNVYFETDETLSDNNNGFIFLDDALLKIN